MPLRGRERAGCGTALGGSGRKLQRLKESPFLCSLLLWLQICEGPWSLTEKKAKAHAPGKEGHECAPRRVPAILVQPPSSSLVSFKQPILFPVSSWACALLLSNLFSGFSGACTFSDQILFPDFPSLISSS